MSDKTLRCPNCNSERWFFADNFFGGYTTCECDCCRTRWKYIKTQEAGEDE